MEIEAELRIPLLRVKRFRGEEGARGQPEQKVAQRITREASVEAEGAVGTNGFLESVEEAGDFGAESHGVVAPGPVESRAKLKAGRLPPAGLAVAPAKGAVTSHIQARGAPGGRVGCQAPDLQDLVRD